MRATEGQRTEFSPPKRRRAKGSILGDERKMGLWILPLFLITGLLGATMAGGLAVLYYGQRVSHLETTTARARADLDQVSDEVTRTADEAQEAIEEQVRQVRESLAQGQPIDVPNDVGIYAVSARHPGGEVRVGSSFTVFSDASETFLVTNYRVVATDDGWALDSAEVFLPERTITARVHNFDRSLDLAILVLRGGPLPVLDWRPAAPAITRGDGLYLAGIAGPATAAVIEGRVGGASASAVVGSIPVNEFLGGGPLLDVSAQVVAVASVDYAPFGRVDGTLSYGVPIRALCRRLIRCTAEDLEADSLGEEGAGAGTSRPARPDEAEATPSPAPEESQPPPPTTTPPRTPPTTEPSPDPTPPPDG